MLRDQIYFPGMFGVAVSRVRTLDSLQVVNFNPRCVIEPPMAVRQFIMDKGLPFEVTLQDCCRNSTFHPDELQEVIAFTLLNNIIYIRRQI